LTASAESVGCGHSCGLSLRTWSPAIGAARSAGQPLDFRRHQPVGGEHQHARTRSASAVSMTAEKLPPSYTITWDISGPPLMNRKRSPHEFRCDEEGPGKTLTSSQVYDYIPI